MTTRLTREQTVEARALIDRLGRVERMGRSMFLRRWLPARYERLITEAAHIRGKLDGMGLGAKE